MEREEDGGGNSGAGEGWDRPAGEESVGKEAAGDGRWRNADGKRIAQGEPVALERGGVEGEGGFVFRKGAEGGGDGEGFGLEGRIGVKDAVNGTLLGRGELVEVEGDEVVLIDGVAGVVVGVYVEGSHWESLVRAAELKATEGMGGEGASSRRSLATARKMACLAELAGTPRASAMIWMDWSSMWRRMKAVRSMGVRVSMARSRRRRASELRSAASGVGPWDTAIFSDGAPGSMVTAFQARSRERRSTRLREQFMAMR